MAAWNSSQPRIEALRARWDRDPSSRLSLQLAEEYRRSGDLDQAMHVLRKGIETTPSIAAEVALGRCLLEANDVAAAKVHLGRAIERDPTQMVAYRHLIEVHTRLGDRDEAEAALDIYRQLNPTDPELDDLAARLIGAEPETRTTPDGPSEDPMVHHDEVTQLPDETALPPVPPPEADEAAAPGVETATFQPLNEAQPPAIDPPAPVSPPAPTRLQPAPAAPFVSFLDRTENEAVTEADATPDASESVEPAVADRAPSRFGFAGAWPEDETPAEETVPFFEPEDPVFQAPEPGALDHAVVIESGQLFALEEVERDDFDLFALPSRPLRRPRRSKVVDSSVPAEIESDSGPTHTLSQLYREQGHEEEADQLERQAQGEESPEVAALPALKAVDFAPLRQLQGVRGVARRRLVVTGYLSRLTEARDVS